MIRNMGIFDKVLRISAAGFIAFLYFTNDISGTAEILLFIAAAVLLLTSLVGFCPIYHILGISTKKRKNPNL